MCGRENVVLGKARKPRSHSHQFLPATSFPYIQSLHQISTLSPFLLLHYEDFKYVEGLYISVCVREENVVPWKSKKPRPDSHQNLSVARFSFTHTLQKISTLSPSPILHYEGFKCVEGSM